MLVYHVKMLVYHKLPLRFNLEVRRSPLIHLGGKKYRYSKRRTSQILSRLVRRLFPFMEGNRKLGSFEQ